MRYILASLLALFVFPSVSFAAVAYDNSVFNLALVSASPYTFTLTQAGANLETFVCLNTATDATTAVTDAGVSLTKIQDLNEDGSFTQLWYGPGVAAGSNTISVSFTAGDEIVYGGAESFSGASQAATPDNSNTSIAPSGNPKNNVITSVADQSWHSSCFIKDGNTLTANTGTTQRGTAGSGNGFYDGGAAITPPSSNTVGVNNSSGTTLTWSVGFTVAPSGTAPITAPTILPSILSPLWLW
jgi:hypothetical protein